MAATAIATLQAVWDCKWSRPGYRLARVAERDQPESAWVCVRSGRRREVADADCERCPFWEQESASA